MKDYRSEWSPLDLLEVMDPLLDISSCLEIQQVLNAIVKQAARLLNAQGSTLAICEPETNLVRVVALHNVPFEYEELILRPGASAASHALTTREPVIINDLKHWSKNHSDVFEGASQEDSPYNAILAVPLIWENRAMGSLTVVDQGERRPFNDNDIRVLSMLANLASSALNNAQLYSQVVQFNHELKRMVDERTQELVNTQKELAQKAEQLQLLLEATVLMQEEERARIARDLHDDSNQLITGTIYQIQAALQSIQNNRPNTAVEKLQTAKELLRQIDDATRRLISDLRPPVLDTLGLVTALRRLTERYQAYYPAKYVINVSGRTTRLSERIETTVYRIVQESLNNIIAHSQAQTIEVSLDFQASHLLTIVNDDGMGFDVNLTPKNRLGLIGMSERAQSIHGQLELWSKPGKGTRVVLEVPISSQSDNAAPQHERVKEWSALTAETPLTKNAEIRAPVSQQKPVWWEMQPAWDETEKMIDKGERFVEERPDIQMIALAVEELKDETALTLVRSALEAGVDPSAILNEGVMSGLKAIGKRFESKYYFLGELLTGSNLAEACIDILAPFLPKNIMPTRGVVVIGAVQGDIHSIGYGLVAKQLELAGYEVHSLGINVPSLVFIEKAEEFNADIIALSAFLVTTIPYCNEVIKYLRDMGLRNRYKVIIGGSETNQSRAENMGADGWANDALEAVKLCDQLLGYHDIAH
jgi:5-methyltetrahydrofolate--homocysteine methyltransferase